MEPTDYIFGIRPVMEAIEAGNGIDKVFLKKDFQGENAAELLTLLRNHRILVQRVPVERLNRITRKNHQGVIAMLSAVEYQQLDLLIPQLYEDGRLPFLVALDQITDVRNFGAIARTAECVGADALIIPRRGGVSVGGDAVKTSAGALSYLPVCREYNLAGALRYLKKNGINVVGVSEKATINYTEADFTVPTVLVMGSEENGISEEVLEECNNKVALPMFGHIESLNVSVAAGVMMYEVVRQRLNANLEVI